MFLTIPLVLWGELKYALFNWFITPTRTLLPLIALLLITFIGKQSLYKTVIRRSACACSIIYLLLISPIGAAATIHGLTLFLSPDKGQQADAIVVLGRGSLAESERAQAAARLWQAQRAPVILTTGRGEAPRLSAQITQLGVPLEAQLIEPQARTTAENATRSFGLLQALGANRLILVTDQPHMLRSVLTFQSFGFQVTPHPVRIPPSLPTINKTALALREYVGLASYTLLGRFQRRALPVATSTETLQNSNMK